MARSRTRRALAGALLLLVLPLAGCGPAALASAPVATTTVLMPRSYHFAPTIIKVPAGTTVTWENNDDFTHSVHLLDGSDIRRTIRPFQSTAITFSTPGTYRYECSLHPHDMQGVVIVGD